MIRLDHGRHDTGQRWFSFFLNIGNLAKFFCSWKTQAYDTAFQSGIGHVIRWPVTLAQYISLLEYPMGSRVIKHRDDNETSLSVIALNINIVLRRADIGGEFMCPEAILNTPRVKVFNGDKYEHEVTPVKKGSRIVLAYKFSLSLRQKQTTSSK